MYIEEDITFLPASWSPVGEGDITRAKASQKHISLYTSSENPAVW